MVNNGGMKDGWCVAITTEGGFTGRGIGHVEVRGAATSDPDPMTRAVAAARPEKWSSAYGRGGGADEVRTTLVLTRGGSSWRVSWSESSFVALPEDLAALFDAAWAEKR